MKLEEKGMEVKDYAPESERVEEEHLLRVEVAVTDKTAEGH